MTKLVDLYGMLPDMFRSNVVYNQLASKVSRRTINRQIKILVNVKKIIRLEKDIYVKSNIDRFKAAQYLYGGYIGFSSALYLHGLKNEVEEIVYTCVNKYAKARHINYTLLKPIYLGEMCFGTTYINNILVSSYAKTVFDMLHRPKYSNLFDLFRALQEQKLSKKDMNELIYYVTVAKNLSTTRRIGYSLEGLTPNWFITKLQKLNIDRGKSFFIRKTPVNLNKKWSLYDDIGINKWKYGIQY